MRGDRLADNGYHPSPVAPLAHVAPFTQVVPLRSVKLKRGEKLFGQCLSTGFQEFLVAQHFGGRAPSGQTLIGEGLVDDR